MTQNPLVNILTKLSSLLAVILLLLGAGLSLASHNGWTENALAGVITVLFASILAVFSLVALNFSNLRLSNQLEIVNETAHQIAQGELLDADFESDDEITDSLKEISENLREKIAVC